MSDDRRLKREGEIALTAAIKAGEDAIRAARDAEKASIIAHQAAIEAADDALLLARQHRARFIRELGIRGELKRSREE